MAFFCYSLHLFFMIEVQTEAKSCTSLAESYFLRSSNRIFNIAIAGWYRSSRFTVCLSIRSSNGHTINHSHTTIVWEYDISYFSTPSRGVETQHPISMKPRDESSGSTIMGIGMRGFLSDVIRDSLVKIAEDLSKGSSNAGWVSWRKRFVERNNIVGIGYSLLTTISITAGADKTKMASSWSGRN